MNDVKTEVLREQKSNLISMVVRLQRGQKNIHQKKYKQPTVENYIETLKDHIIEVSRKDIQRVAEKYLIEDQNTTGWFIPQN